MYTNLDSQIDIYKLPLIPLRGTSYRTVKLSPHLSTGEFIDSMKGFSNEFIKDNGLPMHPNFLQVFELLRKHTNRPLYLGSSVRTYAHEIKKGRSGNSQHVNGLAYDLNGKNLTKILDIAIREKNELYDLLRQLGVNSFGRYDWGYHLDFRESKPNNQFYFWDFSNKQTLNWYPLLPLLIIFYKPILKFLNV